MRTRCSNRAGLGIIPLVLVLAVTLPGAEGIGPAALAQTANAGADPATAGDAAFVAGTEDLPLMPGLRQMPDTQMVFETGRGRLVEAYAKGAVTAAQVAAFYAATLPQLGWRTMSDGTGFRREGETLRIDVLPGPEPRTVRFHIAPSP